MSKVTMHFDVVQKTDEWKDLKVGKVSGSGAIGLSTPARMKTYLYDKISELATGELPFVFVNEAMRRGNLMEKPARDIYNLSHEGDEVVECGIITNEALPDALLSPDGISKDMTHGLEIKCPNSKTHITTILNGGIPKSNIDQVVFYFLIVDDMEYLDFVSYDDRCLGNEYYEFRVTRDDLATQIDEMNTRYNKFSEKLSEYKSMLFL